MGVKSIFPEIRKYFNSSIQVNLANSVLSESPKFKLPGHTPIETLDIANLECINANRPNNCNRLRRSADRDDQLGNTHDFETMSKTKAYCNHIKNSEIETKEVFEQKTSSPTYSPDEIGEYVCDILS